MRDWPHSPVHRLGDAGTFMVTAATYKKVSLFNSAWALDFLLDTLLGTCEKHGWKLQAWAVFPNHYHFVANSPADSATLRTVTRELHSLTARGLNTHVGDTGRKVWHEYWDTRLTYNKSYLARLNYVHQNAVHHRLVRVATQYPWCSAAWFERKADRAFFKTVTSFTGKGIKVPDDFTVEPGIIPSE